MARKKILIPAVLISGIAAAAPAGLSGVRPNILLIAMDDMNYDMPGCFGGLKNLTPNIDRLATEGMRFERAHVTVAICQPSRQCLMTGRYPLNAGFRYFDPVADGVPLLPAILHSNGYMTACFGKAEHLQPRARYQWDASMDMVEIKGGRDPEVYYNLCKDFIKKAGSADKPFFLMANSHDPHRPFSGAPDEQPLRHKMENIGGKFVEPSKRYFPDDAVKLGFLPDIPEVRTETAQYMSSCRRADDTVGEILRALDETGHLNDTIVFFLSDNGAPFPFAKGCVYFNSTRTPLIVRWPGTVKGGTVNAQDYINGIDFMPTVLEILGLAVPEKTDGRSFLPLLEGKSQDERTSTVTVFYNAYPVEGGLKPEQITWFEMRCLHSGSYGYIYNSWADGKLRFTPLATKEILDQMTEMGYGDRVKMFRLRCPEELYNFDTDPDGLNNLAGNPEFKDRLQQMRTQLLEWMNQSGDTDLLPEYSDVVRDGGVTDQTLRGKGYRTAVQLPEPTDTGSSSGSNLIQNGDFANGMQNWSVFKQKSDLSAEVEEGYCRVDCPAGSEVEFARVQQNKIKIKPGEKFRLSARVKGEKLTDGNGAYLSIGFSGNGNATKYLNSGISEAAGTFDWKTVSVQGEVPDGSQNTTVMLMLNGHGTAWFDDVRLSVEP